MRIVHISDLHLSKENYDSFKRFYLEALLKDIKKWNSTKKIELIFLTGDLVDKGGRSLGENPYKLVEEIFINKIIEELKIKRERIILLPGNHDVDTTKIKSVSENGLIALDTIEKINEYVDENRQVWHEGISRIETYKEFEKKFYENTSDYKIDTDYKISNFESCFTFKIDNLNIGIAALNSAWRCSPSLPVNKLLLGTSQILNSKDFFNGDPDFVRHKTQFNIALIHHPLELFSEIERTEIRNFLSVFNFHILLCGHTHAADLINSIGINQNLFMSVAKSAFSNPRERYDTYKPGYTVMDINILSNGETEIGTNFRKYIHNRVAFDKDTEASEDGFYKVVLSTKIDLPGEYQNENSFTKSEKPIIDAWNKITDVLINNSFPDIGAKIGESIREYLLPDKLERYNKDLMISYEIRLEDENHFRIIESQAFTIISNGNPLDLKYYIYVEKNNNQSDKSDIILESLSIDDIDCNTIPNVEVITKTFGELLHKGISIKKELRGQKQYFVKMVTHSVHSLKLNGIWQYNVNTITENLSLNIRNIDDFEIDLIKVGNSSTNFLETSPFLDTKIINYENLLMPGEGFIFVVKTKN